MKNYFICLIFVLIGSSLYSQDGLRYKSEKEIKEPYWFFGGSLWLGFGSYTFVDVNATFGNQITERLALGVSGKYQYYNDKRSIEGNFETSVYGGSFYSQFAIIKDFRNIFHGKYQSGIIAHGEYELLNTKYNYIRFDDPNSNRDRYWLHTILVGGGYFQQLNERARSYIVLLWDVSNSEDNPYTYPQFRIGFTFAI